MHRNPKFKTLTWIFAFAFMLAGMAQAYPIARIIPSGKIKVYRNDQLVQVLQEESPLPTGAMLGAEGNCGLRMDNLFMVAEDGSLFSVQEGSGATQFKIEKGALFFAANSQTGTLVFETPAGIINTQQMIIQASAGSAMLKGFVDVSGGNTMMGVLEGGSMIVSTPDGEKMIATGKQITLAQAGLIKPAESGYQPPPDDQGQPQAEGQPQDEDQPQDASADDIPASYYVAGGLLVALAAGAIAFSGSDSSDPAPASPATP